MKKFLIIVGFLLVVLWFGGFAIFAHRINHYTADDKMHTEAVIALTGGRYRIAEAVNLFNQGKADKLFISGVSKDVSLANIARRQKLKIRPQLDISLGREARDTIGNATETTRWLKENRIRSIRLVTSNYHVERSIVEFRAQNPNLLIIPHPVYSERVSKKWWTTWRTFSLIFTEYNKFIYVYLRTKLVS